MGYVFRAMKWSIAGVDQLPEFDEGEMFTDGLKILVVELAFPHPHHYDSYGYVGFHGRISGFRSFRE